MKEVSIVSMSANLATKLGALQLTNTADGGIVAVTRTVDVLIIIADDGSVWIWPLIADGAGEPAP